MVNAYIVLLGGIIVIILIIMLGLCIYNRIALKTSIDKTAEHAHQQQEGKLEKQLSLQYDPSKKIDDDLVYSSRCGSARPTSRPMIIFTKADMENENLETNIKQLEGQDDIFQAEPVFDDSKPRLSPRSL